jgi:NADH-quinone oxidoreductase subunit N
MTNPTNLLRLLAPEAIVVFTALLALFLDVSFTRDKSNATRQRVVGGVAVCGCLLAIAWIALTTPADGFSMVDLVAVAPILKAVVLGLTIVTVFLSLDTQFTKHLGEFYALLLLAATGLMLLISSNNLLMIFIAVELVSLSLYAMTAFNKASAASAEAGLKYFLFGSTAAAFMLFGISLLYGLTGELQLDDVAQKLQSQTLEPIHYLALVMVLTGFGFKIAAAPFHLWAPDVYQAAPTPIAAFIASASKIGSFFVLARLVLAAFTAERGSASWHQMVAGWMPVLMVVAAISMVLGSVAAITQKRVKRLLAYSAIANAGYALLALMANEPRAISSLLFFVVSYGITVIGAFGVVALVENAGGRDQLSDFAGLSARAPALSACMLVFVLSLAGIPPLSGFFGKFYVFTSALSGPEHLQALWILIVGAVTSAISLYYYLQILKQIYVVPARENAGRLRASLPAQLAVIALAAVTILLGCVPGLLLHHLNTGLTLLVSKL